MRACAWPGYRRGDGLRADTGPHRHRAERAAEPVDCLGGGAHVFKQMIAPIYFRSGSVHPQTCGDYLGISASSPTTEAISLHARSPRSRGERASVPA
jgi:hypothetical protein